MKLLKYGIWLAKTFSLPLTILGIIEEANEEHSVQDVFSHAIVDLKKNNIDYDLQLVNGEVQKVLKSKKWEQNEILLIGSLNRPAWQRVLARRTVHQIIEEVPVPVIYAKETKKLLKNILICFGGLGRVARAHLYAVELAKQTHANLTLLHVIPPIDLDYPPVKEIQENWKHLLESDTFPAKKLRQAKSYADQEGVKSKIKLRHGDPINQILAELSENNYDLVCMGLPPHKPGILQRYNPNVTAEVAEKAPCPTLSVRSQDTEERSLE